MSHQPPGTPCNTHRASRFEGSAVALLIVGVLITFGLTACSGTPSGPLPSTALPLSTATSAVVTGPTIPASPTAPGQPGPTQIVQPGVSSTPEVGGQLPGTVAPTAAPPSSGTATTPPASTPTSTLSEPATSAPSITATAPAILPTQTSQSPPGGSIQTVFIILMENHNWSDIKGSSSAPYINNVLLPQASHAEQYYNPPGNHPSEPNYLWLEAGASFGITNDNNPSSNHQSTTDHLVTLLNNKGISWKAYQEGISGKVCPLVSSGLYAPKHNPMVFFDDVTDGNNPNSAYCIAHERPYTELPADLQNGSVARYNFITPDQCNDMHNSIGCTTFDSIRNGDTWLSGEVPKILNSQAYQTGGALFITWDEGELGSDGPIGMIVLSPYAKGGGYSNAIHYTHSSTLRTLQEIFGVSPLLGAAAGSNDLADLFQTFP